MVWRRDAAIANVISWPNITAKSILREKGMVNFEVNHPIKKNVILAATIVHGTEKTWFKSFQKWRFLLHGCCQFSKGVCRFGMKSVCSPELTAHAFFLHLILGTFNAPFLEANILMKLRSKGETAADVNLFKHKPYQCTCMGFVKVIALNRLATYNHDRAWSKENMIWIIPAVEVTLHGCCQFQVRAFAVLVSKTFAVLR